ncbi:hypothetical protein BV898_17676 [Hypsibius exemplaris]|uniref:DUF1279 domain-containing protein n=1 Tax=Hypsibius exemplaris TaxID=2072580 RepID=A0A9X6RN11_HYPEX|nr:hypothetical protein BV898_17676 [Hypsibius exemplaris]
MSLLLGQFRPIRFLRGVLTGREKIEMIAALCGRLRLAAYGCLRGETTREFKRNPLATLPERSRMYQLNSAQFSASQGLRVRSARICKEDVGCGLRLPTSLTAQRYYSSEVKFKPLSTETPTTVDYRSLSWPSRILVRIIAGYRDYGLTALTFHGVVAGISVLFWWYLVYNHYDVEGWLARLGFISPLDLLLSRLSLAFGAASFPLAYAIHKGTAPLRVLLTLFTTPFIVRSLRKRHIFKLPPGMRP